MLAIWPISILTFGPISDFVEPLTKKRTLKKRVQIVFFICFFGNKKDARRPYDHFGGGIAPRSLLCVRKRRFLFLGKTLILDLSDGRNKRYIRAVDIFYLIYFFNLVLPVGSILDLGCVGKNRAFYVVSQMGPFEGP